MTSDELENLLEPELSRMGYELVDLELHLAGRASVLRVFIDGPDGITVDDCAKVSHRISGVLDVEDPIPGEYNLEVSSPGLDRPLRRASHFVKYAGSEIRVRMQKGHPGRRRLKGRLDGLEDGEIVMTVDGEQVRLPREKIESARLVPQI